MPSSAARVDRGRYASGRARGTILVSLSLLVLSAATDASASPSGSLTVERGAADRQSAGHVLREQLERDFDALHAAVRFELDNCRAAVSLWQVSQAIGQRGREFLDSSAERVTNCMVRGRRETSRRSEQLQARLPQESDLFRFLDRHLPGLLPVSFSWGEVRRTLADYTASVDATFRDVAPRPTSDGFENGEVYRQRLDRMEETLNLKALKVRDAIAQH